MIFLTLRDCNVHGLEKIFRKWSNTLTETLWGRWQGGEVVCAYPAPPLPTTTLESTFQQIFDLLIPSQNPLASSE